MRFVLVHGGFHGAWCWSRTVAELERLGHEAVAIDLPGHGERANETEPTTIAGRVASILAVVERGTYWSATLAAVSTSRSPLTRRRS